MEVLMFEAERFVADCRAAFAKDPTHKAIREVLARTVSDPTAVLKGLGEPKRDGIQELFHSDALTIINVVWAPGNDGHASQPSNVGRHRHLHRSGGQRVLEAREGSLQNRGRWSEGSVCDGR
jgi:hypothetical protein